MLRVTMILLSVAALSSGITLMESGERVLTAGVYSMIALVVVFLYRRFIRSADGVRWIFPAVAAIGATVGAITLLVGMIHTAAIATLAVQEGVWVPLTILRFTTGAMLMYAGAMSIAMFRSIRAGRRWAVNVGAGASLFFWLYLVLLFPLPGTGGTVPPMLGLWSAYLVWLGGAVLTTLSREGVAGIGHNGTPLSARS